jgi:geranylgeranyl diphosphate synthase type II
MLDFENILQSINWHIEPINLYKPIGYALESGGKRLRPVLVQFACEVFDKDTETVENAALAIEIFHNFTLLHDDIMDNSPVRRNRAAVHKKWNANTAILSGDAMMIKSYEFLQKIPQKYWAEAFPLFTQTALQVCEGQQFDMDFESRQEVSLGEYFEMIHLKTAVLLACSLKMGAILADANSKDCELMYDFGIALGIAFQLKDDYLDTFGTFETLGKRIGGDILCKKKTFLLLTALNKSNSEHKTLINNILNSEKLIEEEKIDKIRNIFIDLKIDKICEQEIEKYCVAANDCLQKISVAESKKDNLKKLIYKLKIRQK